MSSHETSTKPIRQAYVRENGKLAMFMRTADSNFWEEHWGNLSDEQLRHVLRPTRRVSPMVGQLLKLLPKDGPILEAGCGTRIYVRRLTNRGYSTIGLDFATETLKRSLDVCPELTLVAGDVFQLPFSDDSLSGYVSLGVVEHFPGGPGEILKEAVRVLRPGGVACVSVPYTNPMRDKMETVSEETAKRIGLVFYQYYFTQRDFEAELRASGLHPTGKFIGGNVYSGLRARSASFRKVARMMPLKPYWQRALEMIPGLPVRACHMMCLVAEKR